ncbi:two-component system-sensor histidine kinase [Nitzschia inconspicua]|uniref:Two-component system-sensor histidine kinase n=1 Tax=Nitzschia inconspicua TaxID=303405 RepID=A0A9K3PZ47_9STRA|nr:two-component system-sensor histidine kinase [Nitzschia inconspicua]
MTLTNPDELMKRKSHSRSVNEYGSINALRAALQSMDHPRESSTATSMQTSWGHIGSVGDWRHVADVATIDAIAPLIQPTNTQLRGQKDNVGRVPGPSSDNEATMKEEMANELRRLAILKSYRVIGAGKNPNYERLVSLASRIFDAPIAYISVLDVSKQHLLAARGLDVMANGEQEGSGPICSHLVDSEHDILVIPDLSQDNQFKNHENVKGPLHLRFCAASPLTCPEGVRLGTLCVFDTQPRPGGLSLDMKQNLREIADMVIDAMVEEREKTIFEHRQPSQMIACTSNDLMTPLMGVVTGLSSVRDDKELIGSLSSQQKEIFNTALACSSVMTRICQKSLESFNKNRKCKVKENLDNQNDSNGNLLNVRELVRHLHMVMDPFPKRVPLVVTIFDEVPPVIVADDLKIFRSIVNFLTNACASTETGSVHLKIYIKDDSMETALEEESQKSIVFLVEDTGCGVSIDQYQHLFKPVVCETDETDTSCTLAAFGDKTSKSNKTGLGLYSVATQITSIGGKYGFRPRGFNENGTQRHDKSGNDLKGSIFWFSIPLVVPACINGDRFTSGPIPVCESSDDEGEDTTHDKRKWNADDEAALDHDFSQTLSVGEKRSFKAFVGERTASRKRKALVIDDSLATRRVISRMLQRLGFNVFEAVNGLEGLKELQASLYDLVLCDFLMPVMDGCDCVQQYRQFEVASRPWFDQYIVGISAHADAADVERGMKVGMNHFLSKPVTIKQLEHILEGREFRYVSERLDSLVVDVQDPHDTTKQAKTSGFNLTNAAPQTEQVMKVCLIVEENNDLSSIAESVTEENGWKLVAVHNGEAALRLLQMRNWDAVLIDDSLPGLSSCMVMEHFREWERNNRVNRQKNVYQANSSFIPSHLESCSTVQLPSGFDGAIGKPVSAKVFKEFLLRALDGQNCMSHDIVRR